MAESSSAWDRGIAATAIVVTATVEAMGIVADMATVVAMVSAIVVDTALVVAVMLAADKASMGTAPVVDSVAVASAAEAASMVAGVVARTVVAVVDTGKLPVWSTNKGRQIIWRPFVVG